MVEVFASSLDQPVGGSGDLLGSRGLEEQPDGVACLLDVAGYPVGDQPVWRHRDELGDEQFPLPVAYGDAEELGREFGVALHFLAGANDGLAGFVDAVAPAGFVDEGEGGAGALAFKFGGAEGVRADDAHGGGPEGAGGGAVVPVGDGQVGQGQAVITGQGDGLV